jgi:hypothetical protein
MSQKTRVETALETLSQQPLVPGLIIPVERFEEVLGIKRDANEFNWLISAIRRHLHSSGLHLSGEGIKITGGYSIVDPRENYWVAKLAMERATRGLEDAQNLLANTNQDGFSALEKARHEATLHTLSLRLSALRKVEAHNRKQAALRRQITEESDDSEES